jgi:hypothetical protein
VGFFEDGEPAGFQLADDLAEDRLVAQRIPCPGSARCRDRKEILAADGLGSAVEKHATRRSLCARNVMFDDVHLYFPFVLLLVWFSVGSGAARIRWAELGLEKNGSAGIFTP